MTSLRTVARWGDPANAVTLPESVRGLLTAALGVAAECPPPAARANLAPPALPAAALAALDAAADTSPAAERASAVGTDDGARLAHAAGKSTVDLLRLRAGGAADAPDAVVRPAGHAEVLAVLRVCAA